MTWARMTSFSKWKLKADKLNPSNTDVGKQNSQPLLGYLNWVQLPRSFNESNLLFYTRSSAAVLTSLVIMRFDGQFILTLSAVKHLGKDNNSQFYDTVGCGGVVVSPSLCPFDLTEHAKGRNHST